MTLVDNLVAYWKMDGDFTDSAGSNHGTGSNVTLNTTYGKINQGGLFNGSNSYVDLGTINSSAGSVSIWVYGTSFPKDYQNPFNNRDGLGLYVKNNGKLAAYTVTSFGSVNYDGTGVHTLSTNTWYHLVATYSSTEGLKSYVNGVLDASVAASGTIVAPGGTARLGATSSGLNRYWTGYLDECGYWNRALSSGEVLALYNSGAGLTYPFGTSPTVTTSSVTNIATNSGLGNGNVTDDGNATITERGICWNTSPNPTTANSKSIATGTTGAFSADIHSLTTGTTYYVRAYATNSVGTSYGSEVTFSPSQVSLQQESGGFIKQENGRTFIF